VIEEDVFGDNHVGVSSRKDINKNMLQKQTSRSVLLNAHTTSMDEAIQMATEGKVTNKNAWDVKIIEGMHDACAQFMAEEGDAYYQFTRAAHLVESGAKVWAHRVENTHLMTTQVYRRLMRMDNKEDEAEGEGGEDGAKNGEGPDGEGRSTSNLSQSENPERAKRKLERTLADTNEELCLKASDERHFDVDPLFRATSRKFDSGHASGLLLNNTRIGPRCNVMLGCDHTVSKEEGDPHAAGGDEHNVEPQPASAAIVEVEATECAQPPLMMAEAEIFPSSDDDDLDADGGPSMAVAEEDSGKPLTAQDVAAADALLEGTMEMDRVDRYFHEQANLPPSPTEDIIPLRRAEDVLRSGPALEEIRKASATDTGGPDDAAPKRRKTGQKVVRFAEENVLEQWIAKDETIKQGKTHTAAVTPLGREWLLAESRFETAQFTDYRRAQTTATAKGFISAYEDESLPPYLRSLDPIKTFMQPFCTTQPHWNFFEKRHKGPERQQVVDEGPIMPIIDDIAEVSSDDEMVGNHGGLDDPFSALLPGAQGEAMELIDAPVEVATVLKVQSVTKPSVVDVIGLRKCMWKHTEEQQAQQLKAPSQTQTPIPFSNIMKSMIDKREIAKISKDGTLSTAFFYFSLLFLANEHGLKLQQTDDMSDVMISYD